jgi:hypothetical protein
VTKIGSVFQFTAPAGWRQFQEGGRQIFQGPNREELIVSGGVIDGAGQMAELASIQERLFKNAEISVKMAAADPALKVTRAFQEETRTGGLECWSLQAETLEGDTLFYQAVFRTARGVLLSTLEAPNTASVKRTFEEFVRSVEVIAS